MRLNHLLPAIAVLASLVTPALSRPLDPDYPCFLIDAAGRAINLGALCAIGRGEATYTPQTPAPVLEPERTAQAPKSDGQVSLVGGNVTKDRIRGYWNFVGQMRNDTGDRIRNVLATVEVRENGVVTDSRTAEFDQVVLGPDQIGTFSVLIKAKTRPDVKITSVQWLKRDGSIGSYP